MALVGSGILLSASTAPAADLRIGGHSGSSSAIVVPDIALTEPASGRELPDLVGGPTPQRPGPELPAPVAQTPPMVPVGAGPGGSSAVTLDGSGIPVRALQGYREAAALVSSADPACHLDWALLAAIGRVESNHARFGGNRLDSAGVAQPGIIGIPLDGLNGTARITDTDRGLLDRDTIYDRAVGPMQFIPSTWRVAGADGNGDAVKNPQNMADAATASAIYLCSGPGDLRRPDDLRGAILRYNASDSYAHLVTAIANAYRHGVKALPASDLAPAISVAAASPAAVKPVSPTTGKRPTVRPGSAPARAGTPPTVAPGGSPKALPRATVPTPTKTPPALPEPAKPVPTTPTPTTPSPAPPTAPTPSPDPTCAPSPTPTDSPPPSPGPTAPAPCLPTPCAPTPAPTTTASPSPAEPAPPDPCPTATATA